MFPVSDQAVFLDKNNLIVMEKKWYTYSDGWDRWQCHRNTLVKQNERSKKGYSRKKSDAQQYCVCSIPWNVCHGCQRAGVYVQRSTFELFVTAYSLFMHEKRLKELDF